MTLRAAQSSRLEAEILHRATGGQDQQRGARLRRVPLPRCHWGSLLPTCCNHPPALAAQLSCIWAPCSFHLRYCSTFSRHPGRCQALKSLRSMPWRTIDSCCISMSWVSKDAFLPMRPWKCARQTLQVTGQYSIAELRRRLIPWGTYQPHPKVTKADHIKALQTRLHLNSFQSTQSFLKLLPLARSPGATQGPARQGVPCRSDQLQWPCKAHCVWAQTSQRLVMLSFACCITP